MAEMPGLLRIVTWAGLNATHAALQGLQNESCVVRAGSRSASSSERSKSEALWEVSLTKLVTKTRHCDSARCRARLHYRQWWCRS